MSENDFLTIKLTDIIDVKTLQKIQGSFAKATGMAALTVDLDGPITELSNGTDFCMKLINFIFYKIKSYEQKVHSF